jgi:DNA-binding winged helix-turn-helix (wHTH) protein/tetratricopeptide (TPR) repeat protein
VIYCFGGFELDEELFELRAGDTACKLNRKSFDLLRYLLEHSGRVVHKEELFAKLWGKEHVGENVLPVHVRTVRKALGEGSESILRTVRGRGYLVVCAVERIGPRGPRHRARGNAELACRDSIFAALAEEYRIAMGGSARVVLMHGPAGIGKTRLLAELQTWARERTPLVLSTTCEAEPGTPDYWWLMELLRAGRGKLEAEPLSVATERSGFDLDRARARLQRLLPARASRADAPEANQFQMFRALQRVIERVSRIAPLVVLIDDLDLAQPASIAVALRAARKPTLGAMLLVATCSDASLGPGHPITRALSTVGGQAGARRLRLEPLDEHAVATVAQATLGELPAAAFTRALWERSDGNPFCVHEMLAAWAAEERPVDGLEQSSELLRMPLPATIREAIARRLDALSASCRELLTWASVIGMQCSVPLLAQVSGLESEPLLQLLSEAASLGVISGRVRDVPGEQLAPGHYRFDRVALRETLYEMLTEPERLLRHRAVGAALERAADAHDSERLPQLAHHFYQAAAAGVVDQAVDYCLAAARRALSLGCHEEAVQYADWAEGAEALRVPRDALRSCLILLTRAETLRRAGAYSDACDRYRRATELARALQRGDLLGLCALGLAASPPWARVPFDSAAVADRRGVIALAREALAALLRRDQVIEIKLRALLLRGPDAGRDAAAIEELLATAVATESLSALHHVSMARLVTWDHPSDVGAALDLAHAMLSGRRGVVTPSRSFAIYEQRVPRYLMLGDVESADHDIHAMATLAASLHIPAFDYSVARLKLARALGDGALDRAPELLREVIEGDAEERDVSVRWVYRLTELWLNVVRGASPPDRARFAGLRMGGDIAEPAPAMYAAFFYMSIDDRRRAATFLAHATRGGLEDLGVGAGLLWHLSACADVAVYLRDAEVAERLYDALLPHAHLNAVSTIGLYRGAVASSMGRLAMVLRRWREAREHFEAGIDLERRLGARLALLFTEGWYARLLASGDEGDRKLSRELAERVKRRAVKLGIARALAARDGAKPRSELGATGAAP